MSVVFVSDHDINSIIHKLLEFYAVFTTLIKLIDLI